MNANNNTAIVEERKKLERYFEVLLYYVIIFTLILSYLPIGVFVNHDLVNTLAVLSFIVGVIGYRLVPVESNGRIKYSFEFKSFVIGSLHVIFVSFVLAASGGAFSPFVLLYIFPIMSAALLLTPKLLYAEILIFLVSIIGAQMIYFPDFLNYRFIGTVLLALISYLLSLLLIKERLKTLKAKD